MKLSMKSRYGLRALIDLAIHSRDEQVALGNVAERNGISSQYLEQVFASLRKAGIVRSVKGPQGGYFLSRDPKEICVAEIVTVLEGSFCLENEEIPENCKSQGAPRAVQKLIVDQVNQALNNILTQLTLADLVKEAEEYSAYGCDMYYI